MFRNGLILQSKGLSRVFPWERSLSQFQSTNFLELSFLYSPTQKSYDHPRHILKSRDITLPSKVHIVKAMVFSVVMYRCENWIIKKAEHWKINVFKLWCWRRLLRVPWTAWKSSQSVNPKGNQPWVFIEGEAPILWPPDAKSRLIGKDPDAGKD